MPDCLLIPSSCGTSSLLLFGRVYMWMRPSWDLSTRGRRRSGRSNPLLLPYSCVGTGTSPGITSSRPPSRPEIGQLAWSLEGRAFQREAANNGVRVRRGHIWGWLHAPKPLFMLGRPQQLQSSICGWDFGRTPQAVLEGAFDISFVHCRREVLDCPLEAALALQLVMAPTVGLGCGRGVGVHSCR